jgi:hypothetical protein
MNLFLNNIRTLFITLFLLIEIGLTGCKVEPNPDEIGGFSNKLLLNRIENTQGGIIGSYEFYKEYPEFLDEAVNAVGSLAIYNENRKLVDGAVGIHIKDSASGYEMLLTAAHLIYDPKSGKRKGDRILFGYEKDSQGNIIQDIRNLPNKRSTINNDDWLLIPVNPQESREPYLVNLKNKDFYLNSSPSLEYPGYFVSISSVTDNDKKVQLGLSKQLKNSTQPTLELKK